MKIYVPVLVVTILLMQLVSAHPTYKSTFITSTNWSTIDHPELGFSAKIPGTAQYLNSCNIIGTNHKWVVESGDSRYVIDVNEFNSFASFIISMINGGMQRVLDDMSKGFLNSVRNNSGIVQSIREYKINGYPANEYIISVPLKDKHSAHNMRAIICVNKRGSYSFAVLSSVQSNPLTVAFFKSVQIK